MDKREIQKLFARINLCGCGTEAHWEVIKYLLERADALDKQSLDWTHGFYGKADDASERWVEFGAKVLDHFELLEHGGGIGYAWLTDDGRFLLEWLRKYGTDDGDISDPIWPEWWCHSPECDCEACEGGTK